MNDRMLSWELVKSIREIDIRIEELKSTLRIPKQTFLKRLFGIKQPERRKATVQRIERLIHSRFCLVHSFLDLNPNMGKDVDSANPFKQIDTGYLSLKRCI